MAWGSLWGLFGGSGRKYGALSNVWNSFDFCLFFQGLEGVRRDLEDRFGRSWLHIGCLAASWLAGWPQGWSLGPPNQATGIPGDPPWDHPDPEDSQSGG